MCADVPDYGVPVTIAAADGCECPGRWCETVATVKALPIEQIRAEVKNRRARPATGDA